jgi:hypothetical protein
VDGSSEEGSWEIGGGSSRSEDIVRKLQRETFEILVGYGSFQLFQEGI